MRKDKSVQSAVARGSLLQPRTEMIQGWLEQRVKERNVREV